MTYYMMIRQWGGNPHVIMFGGIKRKDGGRDLGMNGEKMSESKLNDHQKKLLQKIKDRCKDGKLVMVWEIGTCRLPNIGQLKGRGKRIKR